MSECVECKVPYVPDSSGVIRHKPGCTYKPAPAPEPRCATPGCSIKERHDHCLVCKGGRMTHGICDNCGPAPIAGRMSDEELVDRPGARLWFAYLEQKDEIAALHAEVERTTRELTLCDALIGDAGAMRVALREIEATCGPVRHARCRYLAVKALAADSARIVGPDLRAERDAARKSAWEVERRAERAEKEIERLENHIQSTPTRWAYEQAEKRIRELEADLNHFDAMVSLRAERDALAERVKTPEKTIDDSWLMIVCGWGENIESRDEWEKRYPGQGLEMAIHAAGFKRDTKAESRVATLEVLVREYVTLWDCSVTACDVGPECLVCRSRAAMSKP